jgi:hypothetical protein
MEFHIPNRVVEALQSVGATKEMIEAAAGQQDRLCSRRNASGRISQNFCSGMRRLQSARWMVAGSSGRESPCHAYVRMATSDHSVSVLIVSLSLAFQPPMGFRYPSVYVVADFQTARHNKHPLSSVNQPSRSSGKRQAFAHSAASAAFWWAALIWSSSLRSTGASCSLN